MKTIEHFNQWTVDEINRREQRIPGWKKVKDLYLRSALSCAWRLVRFDTAMHNGWDTGPNPDLYYPCLIEQYHDSSIDYETVVNDLTAPETLVVRALYAAHLAYLMVHYLDASRMAEYLAHIACARALNTAFDTRLDVDQLIIDMQMAQ